jgi:SAM-dependent methyltransferase
MAMKEQWDKRYRPDDYIYGTEPNAFFKSWIDQQEPGKILLPAEGEGRNAVYAAKLGWDVRAFDFSYEAKKKAIRLAGKEGVELDYKVLGAQDYRSDESFDAVALIFAHFGREVKRVLFPRIIEMLKPGGTLLIEVFSLDQYLLDSGGPKNPDMLYDLKEIEIEFAELETKMIKKEEVELQEGSHHQGLSVVIDYIGVKP